MIPAAERQRDTLGQERTPTPRHLVVVKDPTSRETGQTRSPGLGWREGVLKQLEQAGRILDDRTERVQGPDRNSYVRTVFVSGALPDLGEVIPADMGWSGRNETKVTLNAQRKATVVFNVRDRR